jgi:hypothetical protein
MPTEKFIKVAECDSRMEGKPCIYFGRLNDAKSARAKYVFYHELSEANGAARYDLQGRSLDNMAGYLEGVVWGRWNACGLQNGIPTEIEARLGVSTRPLERTALKRLIGKAHLEDHYPESLK